MDKDIETKYLAEDFKDFFFYCLSYGPPYKINEVKARAYVWITRIKKNKTGGHDGR